MPNEHGILSTELQGINVIVGLYFCSLSKAIFRSLRIFNSAKPQRDSHDYFHEWQQRKIPKQARCCASREKWDPPL